MSYSSATKCAVCGHAYEHHDLRYGCVVCVEADGGRCQCTNRPSDELGNAELKEAGRGRNS